MNSECRFFVVDDVQGDLDCYAELVRSAGYLAAKFSSPADILNALNAMDAPRKIIVLSDIDMKPMDGVEFLCRIRSLGIQDVEVVLMSNSEGYVDHSRKYFPLSACCKQSIDEEEIREIATRAFKPKLLVLDDKQDFLDEVDDALKNRFTVIKTRDPDHVDPGKNQYALAQCGFVGVILDVDFNNQPLGVEIYRKLLDLDWQGGICLVTEYGPEHFASFFDLESSGDVCEILGLALTKAGCDDRGGYGIATKGEFREIMARVAAGDTTNCF